ncbi:S8 family peptidase [Streptomyces sp. NRRL S-455]|uniref:S8 family peptidase n=1 Tax=Streptomyces sp. NRRL S-455 TaxID=1463908 RepID=UPI0004C1B219|nr:S8 family serine peptidase [Streptomyces sp. NRRL S-455]
MTCRPLHTAAITAVALSALLGATVSSAGSATAAESTPRSWESAALDLPAAHKITRGKGVTVAVLDSGIEQNHPALRGKVDKIGPDFYDQDGLKPGDKGYGSHGTAMVSDVLKVAPEARIITARVLDDREHDEKPEQQEDVRSPLSQGVDWAVKNGADVISMSLSGGRFNEFDEFDVAAMARATQKGVVLLAGSGNSAKEFNDGNFPAGYANVISVAATDQNGERAEFSTVRTHNTIAAPGVAIISADKNTNGFRPIQGTSPATALASGVAALVMAKNPDLTPAQLREILIRTADHPKGGHNPLVGAGQINAAAAVRAASSPKNIDTSAQAYKGKLTTFGKPSGTSKFSHPPINQGYLTIGLGTAGAGVLLIAGGVLLALRKRRQPGF